MLGTGNDVAAWESSAPTGEAGLAAEFFAQGEELLGRLPPEAEAAAHVKSVLDAERTRFLRAHAEDVYVELTDDLRRTVRDEELVYAAAERFPGLVPTREAVARERERGLLDKKGIEIAQGIFF